MHTSLRLGNGTLTTINLRGASQQGLDLITLNRQNGEQFINLLIDPGTNVVTLDSNSNLIDSFNCES